MKMGGVFLQSDNINVSSRITLKIYSINAIQGNESNCIDKHVDEALRGFKVN